jgi:lysophospholipase L1-like esterase
MAIAFSFSNRQQVLVRLYPYRYAGTALFLSLLLGLGFVELATRLLDPLGISYYEETGRYHLDKIADDILIYRHRPSSAGVYQGVEVTINEMGLRDDPIQPKEPREFRVLALGDSVTFGWGVPHDQIFATRLERILSQKLGRPVIVINTGVGSYNTVQEYAFLKNFGLALHPDLVMLLYVDNDVEVHRQPFNPWSERALSGKSPPEVAMILLGRSWFYRLAVHAAEHGWLGTQTKSWPADGKGKSAGWTASMGALQEIVQLSQAHNLPVAPFFFRWEDSASNRTLMGDVRQTLAPLPVGDVGQWISGQDLRRYMNSKVDTHPNAEGHRVIAEHMAEYLEEQGLLPVKGHGQP